MLAAHPSIPARPLLQVLDERRPEQDCGRCRSMRTCWDTRLKPAGVVINLLVCRIKRGIDLDRSARTLIRMLQPKFLKLAKRIGETARRISTSELVAEMQSKAIESLLTKYALGDIIHPLRWLFGKPNGAITRWAQRFLAKLKREAATVFTYDGDVADVHERINSLNYIASGYLIRTSVDRLVLEPAEYDANAEASARSGRALALVDDGITLSVAEYRIMQFCLSNAREDSLAPISGLHQALAKKTGLDRRIVTRIYGQACRRMMEATGEAQVYLERNGLHFPKSAADRRRARFQQRPPKNDSMTADEIADMLELRTKGASVQDVAWIFGVHDEFIFRLARKFKGLTRSRIVEMVTR